MTKNRERQDIEQSLEPPSSLSHGNYCKARALFALQLWPKIHGEERINAHAWATISGVKQNSLYLLSARWYKWEYVKIYGTTPGRPGPRGFTYEITKKGQDYWHRMRAWYPYRLTAAAHVLQLANIVLWWPWRGGIAWVAYPWQAPTDYHFTSDSAEIESVTYQLMARRVYSYSSARFTAAMCGRDVGSALHDFMKAQGLDPPPAAPTGGRTSVKKPMTKEEWEDWARQFVNQQGIENNADD